MDARYNGKLSTLLAIIISLLLSACSGSGGESEGNSLWETGSNGKDYTVLAFNDLGMHCADQDYRIFSILPPYNVLNAQVLKKGAKPTMMSPADGIKLTYQSVNSNYFSDYTDPTRTPDAIDSITTTALNSNTSTTSASIYKSNFWATTVPSASGISKLGFVAYEKLYPPNILSAFPATDDLGLPAPNLAQLYLGDKTLTAEQSAMPGKSNTPKPFNSYINDLPFFSNFNFGYTVRGFNRYTAEGIPMSTIDDSGRSNPYPLLRVAALDKSNNILASVDTVVPTASEADCAICHTSQNVCDIDSIKTLVCSDIANANYPAVNFIDTALLADAVIGTTNEQKVINSAKINILKLHDTKHGTTLAGTQMDGSNADGSTPNVVCANCHYSPALDLAHLGPVDDNGKEQTKHISMSRAMHGVHGNLPLNNQQDYGNLFPNMPPPNQRTTAQAKDILQNTCYNCHPGKKALCLRGAMGGAGIVCQDCHGQLTQVGDDFSQKFPQSGFPSGADLTKRIPWASEPSCDSCHVGDVLQVAQLGAQLNDTIINAKDSHGNTDNLRLLMAYKITNHKSKGGPDKLPILRFPNSRFAATEKLYRLSGANAGINQGHGNLSCEGCHGSTHAIWPNKNPNSNDNKASIDNQQHAGTLRECSACHIGDLGVTLKGPHGMHPVGDVQFSGEGHESLASSSPNTCRACHGQNGEGSVLSRAAKDRVLSKENGTVSISKGQVITCSLCHSNKL